ncbi:MAG: hypothetical protein ACKOI3_01055, partial [Actinomycetota bacterium]
MMHAAVVSFHTNPYTCGVARFNHSLAAALGVPLIPLDSYLDSGDSARVMLSIKLEEITATTLSRLGSTLKQRSLNYDLFLHAVDGSELEQALLSHAGRVFAASAEIADRVRTSRPDVT